jgi:hypothetical protein
MAIGLLTLALVGSVALLATIVLGYGTAAAGAVRVHFLAALGATTILVMAHSFIMFFLIATGVEMKELEKQRGWGDSFRRRTVGMKARVFPPMTLALLLVIVNFILGAAAHTRAIPGWLHGLVAWATLAACLAALWREYQALAENNRLIAEVARRRSEASGGGTSAPRA